MGERIRSILETVAKISAFRQCQRRSLTCVYPSESRRGMRKKNVTLLKTEAADLTESNK